MCKAFVMVMPGFDEEHRLDGAAGTERFFDEADAFDTDEAVFGGQAAAKSETKLFEPAIVAAGEERGIAGRSRVTGGFAGCGHSLEGSKFLSARANSRVKSTRLRRRQFCRTEQVLFRN